jgi:DNA repair exonuclease SbcCD ATPase subunit
MADANVAREASNVVTSENATTFYAERLGLADSIEPPEAAEQAEPAQDLEQSELEAEEEAKEVELEKPKDKLNKRFEKVSKRAQDAEAKAAELENRLKELEGRVNPQQQQVQQQPVYDESKPSASQFDDAFEYAEALAKWSADNALKQRDAQDAQRKQQDSWLAKLEKAKAEYDDWDDVVPKSKVIVRDEIRDSILESEVGPQILYALASDDKFAKELAAMPIIKALKELGKLEAKFEAVAEKPARTVQEPVSRSKAPSPIRPLTGGRAGADVLVDTNGEFMGTPSQWKAARLAGKIR